MNDKTSEHCWQAILDRDPRADGHFVYAVRTTGIYCRPTCHSRRPLRKNVQFFATGILAEQRGYRPCRKCRPQSEETKLSGPVERVCRLIRDSLQTPTLPDLAAAVGLSGAQLRRAFQQELGVTPKEFGAACRSQKLRQQLAAGADVTSAAYTAGFNAISRCYETSDRSLGMSPDRYRRGGAGLTIRYVLTECRYGRVLVGATDRGVCSIEFGKTDRQLMAAFRARFSAANLLPATEEVRQLVNHVVVCLDEPGRRFDVPLDIQGTAFQHRVWQALSEIPPGETASYGEIAARLGSPRAARAVGNACAANRLAVAIPCHRAVHADGSAQSYRWGAGLKQQLLKAEVAACADS